MSECKLSEPDFPGGPAWCYTHQRIDSTCPTFSVGDEVCVAPALSRFDPDVAYVIEGFLPAGTYEGKPYVDRYVIDGLPVPGRWLSRNPGDNADVTFTWGGISPGTVN